MKEWYEEMLKNNAKGMAIALELTPITSGFQQDVEAALEKLTEAIKAEANIDPKIWMTVLRATAKNIEIYNKVEPCPKQ